jgi:hypothetical protein
MSERSVVYTNKPVADDFAPYVHFSLDEEGRLFIRVRAVGSEPGKAGPRSVATLSKDEVKELTRALRRIK